MTSLELRWTTQLSASDYADMAVLFDSEYEDEWGPWNPKQGYGYARGELHCLVRDGGNLVGYAASARRFVAVGKGEVVVAGIGGVLTAAATRGQRIGHGMMSSLQEAMRGDAPAEFGLLGCREEVVPFYQSCGFVLVESLIRDVSPRDAMTVIESAGPTLVCAGTKSIEAWPAGTIDLRGLPW
ncbi:GNAT family N-acetyltransferase [Arthrobacter sp. 9AX]|uniref:GNAT family N-acetyltransferase n=1 Tax=Arthrobacter sp. 9AX TaxID=2653131 RepID=UPI00135976EF|nr:GNAT family N-acetyltransferase [Arthrobacter sp. 9AX]